MYFSKFVFFRLLGAAAVLAASVFAMEGGSLRGGIAGKDLISEDFSSSNNDAITATGDILDGAEHRELSNNFVEYLIALDMCHSSYTKTGTSDRVQVDFYTTSGSLYYSVVSYSGLESGCGQVSGFGINGPDFDFGYFIIKTFGDNAAGIDRLALYKNKRVVHIWGLQDNGNYCLSTDRNDHFEAGKVCPSGWKFTISGGEVASCNECNI